MSIFLLLVLGICLAQPLPSVQKERTAVCAIADSIPLLKSFPLNPWNCSSPASHCSFQGVTCFEGLVSTLILVGVPVVGTLPRAIGDFSSLQYLGLVGAGLVGTIPTEIGKLTSCQVMFLSANGLVGTIPTEIIQQINLRFIDFSANRLSGTLPSRLARLTNLVSLTVSRNFISGTVPSGLFRMVNFRFFSVSDNLLSGTIPTDVGSGFINFALDRNSLSGTIPTQIGTNIFMTALTFATNRLTGTIPSELGNLVKLQTLNLFFNQIGGTIPSSLSRLTELNILQLHGNSISGTIPPQLSKCQELQRINLSLNLLTGPIPSSFGNLSNLQFLEVQVNHLTGHVPVRIYHNISTLERLIVSTNHLVLQAPKVRDSLIFSYFPQYCISDNQCSNFETCNLPTGICLCIPGYERGPDAGCQDINECVSNQGRSLSNCTSNQYCINTNGSFGCFSCEDPSVYKPEMDGSKRGYAESFLRFTPNALQTTTFQFEECFGGCEAGFRFFSYDPIASECAFGVLNLSKVICSYPCFNLTSRDTETSAYDALCTELTRPFIRGSGNHFCGAKSGSTTFLEDIFIKLFNSTVTLIPSKKRTSTFIFQVTPCSPDQIQPIQTLVTSISSQIVPNAPNLAVVVTPTCQVTISTTDNAILSTSALIGIIVGSILTILFLLIIFFYVIRVTSSEINHLPEDIAWSYKQYLYNPFGIGWSFRGSSKSGYYYKELQENTEFYQRAVQIFDVLSDRVNNQTLIINSIIAVYNPVLVNNFVGAYKIATTRSKTKEFTKKSWEHDPMAALKHFVMEQYNNQCSKFDWNKKEGAVPILPVLHGTDGLIAEKICENGFAALSSLDSGFFGKGIYFTSHSLYTLPYIASRSTPAIILSWVVPGNIFPVSEDHQGPTSLAGTALKSGCSHYALTTKNGKCINQQLYNCYDELVIGQESLVSPAFIILIDSINLGSLVKEWQRDIPKFSGGLTPRSNSSTGVVLLED